MLAAFIEKVTVSLPSLMLAAKLLRVKLKTSQSSRHQYQNETLQKQGKDTVQCSALHKILLDATSGGIDLNIFILLLEAH